MARTTHRTHFIYYIKGNLSFALLWIFLAQCLREFCFFFLLATTVNLAAKPSICNKYILFVWLREKLLLSFGLDASVVLDLDLIQQIIYRTISLCRVYCALRSQIIWNTFSFNARFLFACVCVCIYYLIYTIHIYICMSSNSI